MSKKINRRDFENLLGEIAFMDSLSFSECEKYQFHYNGEISIDDTDCGAMNGEEIMELLMDEISYLFYWDDIIRDDPYFLFESWGDAGRILRILDDLPIPYDYKK